MPKHKKVCGDVLVLYNRTLDKRVKDFELLIDFNGFWKEPSTVVLSSLQNSPQITEIASKRVGCEGK